jgi:hypothetical protein
LALTDIAAAPSFEELVMGKRTNVSRHLIYGTLSDPPPWPARENLDDETHESNEPPGDDGEQPSS